jgi:hypothetical protein
MRSSSGGHHYCSLNNDAGGHIFPKRHQQLARQRHDGCFLETPAVAIDSRFEPNSQRRLRLMTQPEPSKLNERCPQSRVTRLGHALFAIDCSALPRRRRQSRIGSDLAAIVEVSAQTFRPEDGSRLGAYALDGEQHRRGFWRNLLCGQKRVPFALRALDLLEQEFQSIEFAADLSREMPRPRTTIARSQLLEPLPTIATRGSYPAMPCEESNPLILLTCRTRSFVNTLHSRHRRRRSSSSGVGALTNAHTRGSPRLYARNARSSASPSILSVFASRRLLCGSRPRGARYASEPGLPQTGDRCFALRRNTDVTWRTAA